jgi:ATP-dependent RNA helicase SUPV3L1/SUV3
MILSSQPKQLRLQDDGQILWQQDASNPLPGAPVARIVKGESALKPKVEALESLGLEGENKAAVELAISVWLDQHITASLGPLVNLTKEEESFQGPAKEIAQKVYEGFGIIQRSDIETQIAALDPEARKALRQRHIRLGPVLVFMPDLTRPAAVRLRAVLWWVWNDKTMPAPVPKDGVVSVIVDEAQIDPVFQRAIGYPVYGGRAIRVDMLDRLISAIYDNAKAGSFKATHTMAEWLGSPIPDLYKVLEAMGHKKTHDPAEQSKVEEAAAAESAPVAEAPVAETPAPEAVPAAEAGEPVAPAPVAVAAAKPDLATFRLKRGKASEAERPRAPRGSRKAKKPATPPPFEKLTEEELKAIADREAQREARKAEKKDKPREHKPRDRGDRDKRGNGRQENVVVMEAKPAKLEDSPFAILQQLKTGKKD